MTLSSLRLSSLRPSARADAAIVRLAVAMPLVLNVAAGELDRHGIGSCFTPPTPDAFFTVLWGGSVLTLPMIARAVVLDRAWAAGVGLVLLGSANTFSLYALGDMIAAGLGLVR